MNIALVLILAAVIVAAIVAGRWAGTDGGPRRVPPPRPEDDWSPDLPSRPYAH